MGKNNKEKNKKMIGGRTTRVPDIVLSVVLGIAAFFLMDFYRKSDKASQESYARNEYSDYYNERELQSNIKLEQLTIGYENVNSSVKNLSDKIDKLNTSAFTVQEAEILIRPINTAISDINNQIDSRAAIDSRARSQLEDRIIKLEENYEKLNAKLDKILETIGSK